MNTRNLLLSSVAAFALIGSAAFAQTDTTEEPELDADGQPIVVEGGTAATDALGGQIVVEQPDAEVEVTVDDPVVTVDQARPEVLVEQAEPQITVTVAEPNVNVEQQAPIITIEQAQPQVTVSIPEPVITVRMPEPDVNVATSEPEISVQQPEPIVRFVRPEPRITIEEAEPQVQVTSAEPEIRVNRADAAEVTVEKAQAEVTIEETGDAEVQVTEAAPEVTVESAEGADVQVEQAEAEIVVEENVEQPAEAEAEVAADDTRMDGDRTMLRAPAVEREGYTLVTVDELNSEDITGMRIYGANDEDIGEVSELVMSSDGSSVERAVLDIGGFLGLGEHRIAVTFDELQIMRGETGAPRAFIDATQEELEAQPEYEG